MLTMKYENEVIQKMFTYLLQKQHYIRYLKMTKLILFNNYSFYNIAYFSVTFFNLTRS